MNKEEVIKGINSERYVGLTTYEDEAYNKGLDIALYYINQIDEPGKPVVPQFVADWYEENKDDFEFNLYYYLCVAYHDNPSKLSKDIYQWFADSRNEPIQTLVNMHQFGYEVEKEKLYTARLKLISVKKYSYINKEKDEKRLFISDSDGLTDVYQTHFTQAELEELDVWNNPAFEIEEVEE